MLQNFTNVMAQRRPSYEANRSSDNKNFPELYDTQKIITAFTRSRFFRILSQLKPIHILSFSLF